MALMIQWDPFGVHRLFVSLFGQCQCAHKHAMPIAHLLNPIKILESTNNGTQNSTTQRCLPASTTKRYTRATNKDMCKLDIHFPSNAWLLPRKLIRNFEWGGSLHHLDYWQNSNHSTNFLLQLQLKMPFPNLKHTLIESIVFIRINFIEFEQWLWRAHSRSSHWNLYIYYNDCRTKRGYVWMWNCVFAQRNARAKKTIWQLNLR